MSVMNFNPEFGRYEVDIRLTAWYIDPVTFSSEEGLLDKLMVARRSATLDEINSIYDKIEDELKEIGLIKS